MPGHAPRPERDTALPSLPASPRLAVALARAAADALAVLLALGLALVLVLGRAAPAGAQGPVCDPVEQWVWDGPTRDPMFPEACTTPLVLQVTDDNLDGRIDALDETDVVFIHSNRFGDAGVITAVDAKTGERVWQERTGGVFSASPVAADGKVYFVSESGETIVVRASRTPEILARNDIGERTVASLAIADRRIFIRTDRHLIAIGG